MTGNEALQSLEDVRWLVSNAAQEWLKRASDTGATVAAAKKLRAAVGPDRASLVLQQVELRRRASKKFAAAGRMFFTPRSLEQATSDEIAAYKAGRFSAGQRVADLCCGIGGDLLGLAERGTTVGVDSDEIVALLAEANCMVAGNQQASVEPADAETFSVEPVAAWHIDPDRRAHGGRTTRLDNYLPTCETLDRLLAANRNGAVKLAPATRVPQHWAQSAEMEWIGCRGECKQQVAWFGELARHPGCRTATIVHDGRAASIVGEGDDRLPVAAAIGCYVYEPHSAVLAAGVTATLARKHELAALAHDIVYLTSDRQIDDPALAVFEVDEVLPLDIKRLKRLMRERKIGRLEVKRRGAPVDPRQIGKQLQAGGDRCATLLIAPVNGSVRAILARRVMG